MRITFAIIMLVLRSQIAGSDYIEVDPSSLGMEPDEYVGVPIKLKCRFVKMDSTWLDDRDMYRSAQEYTGFVVEAGDRIFAQLFYPKANEAYLARFEKGDRLIVYGKVLSSKHNFPWIDVDKIAEGWVIGEEPEEVRKKRIEVAKNYEEFLKARSLILRELKLDDVREIFEKQAALIHLLIEKKVFSQEEFDQAVGRQKVKPTPVPPWEKILEEIK